MAIRGAGIVMIMQLIAAAILCLVILVLSLVSVSTPGPGAEVCLSKHEARKLWPRSHIYWYSSDRCWSNRRGPPRGIKVDPVPATHAMAKEVVPDSDSSHDNKTMASGMTLPECCWPLLDADASGNLVEPPMTFIQRWYEFPSLFSFYRQRLLDR
jgi:hypothetical protein